MFTYIQILGYFILPPLAILGAIYWPLLGRREILKIAWLGFMATVWTTPWDNFILSQQGWTYPPGSILGRLGHIPLEEHMFFVLQPALLVLLHCLFTHGRLLPFDLDVPARPRPASLYQGTRTSAEEWPDSWGLDHVARHGDEWTKDGTEPAQTGAKRTIQTLPRRPVAAGLWLLLTLVGLILVLEAHGLVDLQSIARTCSWGRRAFYLGWIVFWISPVIAFLVYLGGRLTREDTWTVLVGTGWLWIVDTIALRSGSWAISEDTTFGIDLWPGLPIEEAIFFILTSYLVVLTSSLISHLHALLVLSPDLPPCPPSNLAKHIHLLAEVAFRPPPIDEEVLVGLRDAERTLRRGSKSFDVAKLAFGREMRLGLVVIYAWCRVTDNLIDEPHILHDPSPDHTSPSPNDLRIETSLETARRQTLHAIREHLAHTYNRIEYPAQPYPPVSDARTDVDPDEILDTISHLTESDRAAFHLFSSLIPRLIPIYPFLELCDGYQTDLAFPPCRLSVSEASAEGFNLEGRLPIKTLDDLLEYADDVAGSIAAAICYLSWSVLTSSSAAEVEIGLADRTLARPRPVQRYTFAKELHNRPGPRPEPEPEPRSSDIPPDDVDVDAGVQLSIIRAAREMGRALQLVNVARDVAKDALISRLYVPLPMFASASALCSVLFPTSSNRPPQRTEVDYSDYSLPLLDLADRMRLNAMPAIERLPRTARGGTRAMVSSYFEIASAIRAQGGQVDERGVRVNKWRRVGRALGAMWGVT